MIEDIDWTGMWKELMQNASWSRRRRGSDMINFWDKRARRYSESIKRHNHAKRIIAKLDIDPECTVLGIGAGPGTLAIPLAKMVRHITAIDPSKGMLEYLKENAVSEGLKNITCINKKWEDVAIGRDIAEHDIVIASHSITMLDIKEALSKMNDAAKRYVYIFTFAGARMWDYNTLWPKIYGEEYQPGPDYIYLYNVLYEMGIYANVEITNSEYKQQFSNLDEVVAQWKENLDVLTPDAEEVIRSHLSENLIEGDGALWSKREMRSAMIWWRKNVAKIL
ncbi:class I SAM-dependent methyltransferase [Methanosarcinales archaeon]|nr:MAG: class I SAM-dependent methyltransferase [Methanosarcinales archaeon]